MQLDKQCQTCPVFLHIFTIEVQAFIHVINSIFNGRYWSSVLATTQTLWLLYHYHLCGAKNGPLFCSKTPSMVIFPHTAAYDLPIQYWTLTMPWHFVLLQLTENENTSDMTIGWKLKVASRCQHWALASSWKSYKIYHYDKCLSWSSKYMEK